MSTAKILAAGLALLLSTVIYSFIMYQTDKVDRNVVIVKVISALEDGDLLPNLFPPSTAVWTRDNLSGIDQSIESFYALMVTYQDKENPWLNALNPGYYQAVDDEIPQSEEAKLCAMAAQNQLDNRTIWYIDHKPRFWHGVKALELFALQYLHLSQIHWLIKISTFFAFALLAVQVMFLDRQVGLAYIAFTFSAFYCSAVLFFGGVAYSVPLMATAMWGTVWLGFRMLPCCCHNRRLEIFVVTLGGTVLCFFFQLGGEEIYAMSLVFFVEIFLPSSLPARQKLARAFESSIFFLVGFFGSILFKHLLIVCLSGSFAVVAELVDKILLRTSNTNNFGTVIGFLDIFKAQFYWYGVASYGVESLFQFVNFSKTLSFVLLAIVGCWLIALKVLRQHQEFDELSVAFAGFLLMLSMVVGRYMLLRNHSDIHVFFVNRYLFVYAGTVYFFLLWLSVSARALFPKRSLSIHPPVSAAVVCNNASTDTLGP
jgi:hypothetical protein